MCVVYVCVCFCVCVCVKAYVNVFTDANPANSYLFVDSKDFVCAGEQNILGQLDIQAYLESQLPKPNAERDFPGENI